LRRGNRGSILTGGHAAHRQGPSTGSSLGTVAGATALRFRAAGSVSAFVDSVTSSTGRDQIYGTGEGAIGWKPTTSMLQLRSAGGRGEEHWISRPPSSPCSSYH
jgi:hypothetical protein